MNGWVLLVILAADVLACASDITGEPDLLGREHFDTARELLDGHTDPG
jgi:hypothetical protein